MGSGQVVFSSETRGLSTTGLGEHAPAYNAALYMIAGKEQVVDQAAVLNVLVLLQQPTKSFTKWTLVYCCTIVPSIIASTS